MVKEENNILSAVYDTADAQSLKCNHTKNLQGSIPVKIFSVCVCVWRVPVSEFWSGTACYYGPCDWQRVGEEVIAGVCLRWRRAFGGADVQQTEARKAHNWWLIPLALDPLPFCLLGSTARPWAGEWWQTGNRRPCDWADLKDFTCLDLGTSGLVGSRSTSHVNLQTVSLCFPDGAVRHGSKCTDRTPDHCSGLRGSDWYHVYMFVIFIHRLKGFRKCV